MLLFLTPYLQIVKHLLPTEIPPVDKEHAPDLNVALNNGLSGNPNKPNDGIVQTNTVVL